jgi:hypothetical protein
MDHGFNVAHLSVERLLADWRWLCPQPLTLLARNAFGDLFLKNESGRVFMLAAAMGEFTEIAESEKQFRSLANTEEKLQQWFAKNDAEAAARRGLSPNSEQCIGFKVPLIFAESASAPNNAYVADLYEQVSFLGHIHQQISELPDGTKIKLEPVD